MPEPPKGPPPPPPERRGAEPGPPPAKRAEMRDAVQDVMRKVKADRAAEMQQVMKQHAKDQHRRVRGIILVLVAAVLLVCAAVWALPRWRHPFEGRSGAAAERDARTAILFAASVVDRFGAEHQRLPHSLRETGIVLPGVTYVEGVGIYHLSAVADGRRIEFVSTQDRNAFAAGR